MFKSEDTMSEMDEIRSAMTGTTPGSLWVVLARAYGSLQALVEHSIAALDIGLSDFMILEALLHTGPQTMSDLCRKVLLKNAAMTSAVDRLEKKQLIHRVTISHDRRVRTVALTATGRELIEPLFAHHIKDIEAVMKNISPSDREEARRILKLIGFSAEAKLNEMKTNDKAAKKKKEQ